MPPIEGMKNQPMGLPLMVGAWLGCVSWASTQENLLKQFTHDTGMKLEHLCSRGINRLIDESTGHDRAIIVAWLDWVTENYWGIEGQDVPEEEFCEE